MPTAVFDLVLGVEAVADDGFSTRRAANPLGPLLNISTRT